MLVLNPDKLKHTCLYFPLFPVSALLDETALES